MSTKNTLVAGLALCWSFISTLSVASSSFENGVLKIPYLAFENSLYKVNLVYVENTNPLDFTLDVISAYPADTAVPKNSALYAGNVLSIPTLRADAQSYQIQLNYIEDIGVYRLLEIPFGLDVSTSGVLCSYFDITENDNANLSITSASAWVCTDDTRLLAANGIPDHPVGAFPNSRSTISEQDISQSFPLAPVETNTATELGGPAGDIAYVLNGIKVDAGTGGTCNDTGDTCNPNGVVGNWSLEALGHTSFSFGLDDNNAHIQPGGIYHYHGMPEGFVTKQGGNSSTMTIVGWAVDGFPIYARYGYSEASNESSALKVITGSYQLVSNVSDSRPATELFELGTFTQDWEYVAGSGDLDECNGRFGVTPEFPEGIYHYYSTDSYPYFQRCVKGFVEARQRRPDGGDDQRPELPDDEIRQQPDLPAGQ